MRIPTIALPLVGVGAGLLLSAVAGLSAVTLLVLTGVLPDGGWTLAMRTLTSGALAGAIVGICRATDRWLTEPFTGTTPKHHGYGSGVSRHTGALLDRRGPIPWCGRADRPTWPRSV